MLACLVLTWTLCFPAWAELLLDVPIISLTPKPEDDVVETTFHFRNVGDKPVKILALESLCLCLSAELDKATYQPGEQGTGKAAFKVPAFAGRYEKKVRVTTDAAAQTAWEIPFVMVVPEVIEIEPATLRWGVGDEPVEKTITMKIRGETPMQLLKITVIQENVGVTFKEVTPGREYLISIKPTSTETVTLGILKMEMDSPIPKLRQQSAYFSIHKRKETDIDSP